MKLEHRDLTPFELILSSLARVVFEGGIEALQKGTLLTACFIYTPKMARTRGMREQAGAQELCGSRRPIMKHALRIDGWAKQLFQCLDVFGEGLAAGFGDAIEGLRLSQHELLFVIPVPGFFGLEQLRAQVAGFGLRLCPKPCKLSLFHPP